MRKGYTILSNIFFTQKMKKYGGSSYHTEREKKERIWKGGRGGEKKTKERGKELNTKINTPHKKDLFIFFFTK